MVSIFGFSNIKKNIFDCLGIFKRNLTFYSHKLYRVLFFDNCPNWQYLFQRSVYRMKEWQNRKNLFKITLSDKKIVKSILNEGVFVSSLNELGFDNTEKFKELANKLFDETAVFFKDPPTHLGGWFEAEKFTLRPPIEYILEKYPDIFQFALNPRLLSIAQHYIGAPSALIDIDFKIDIPGGNDTGSKVWHYDKMDYKILKIFVYFSEVTSSSPAFEYIPAKKCWNIKLDYFKESTVYGLTDKQNIVRVEAPSESVLFIGVDRILHHLSIPTHNENKSTRKAVVCHYVSTEIPDQCRYCRNGAAGRWGTEKAKKLLKSFKDTLPEQTRKYLYIHDS
ncbi:MAG: hypothetical protein WCK43_02835 [bacterium]